MVVEMGFNIAGHEAPKAPAREPLPEGAFVSRYDGTCAFCKVRFEAQKTVIMSASRAAKMRHGNRAVPTNGYVHFPECPPKDERPVQESVVGPDLTNIQALLGKAMLNGLKSPKIILTMPDGQDIRVTMPSTVSANRGRVYVNSNERDWTARKKFGWLDNGTSRITNPAVLSFLVEVNKNPLDAVVVYGKKTGICSFCARDLTDERSISAGYGPICANKYSLPWGD